MSPSSRVWVGLTHIPPTSTACPRELPSFDAAAHPVPGFQQNHPLTRPKQISRRNQTGKAGPDDYNICLAKLICDGGKSAWNEFVSSDAGGPDSEKLQNTSTRNISLDCSLTESHCARP